MKWNPVKAPLRDRIVYSGGQLHLIPRFKTYEFKTQQKIKKIIVLMFVKWGFSWTYTKGLK